MKTYTLLLSMASAALVAAECPGLVPCIRQAQDANSCSGSDPACFCLENFLAVATNCLTSNGCPADDLTNLNLSYEAQCPDGPPGGASSSVISTTEPGVPTDISSTAAPSTTAETVPTDTPTDAESSTAAPETTPGSSAPSSHVDEPTSTEHGPGSSTPVPVSTPTVIETSSVPINSTQKMTTSTIYATQVRTVTHCPETVTDCPTKPHVTTEIIAISTTICPVDETKKVPAPPTPTPAHPVKPSQGGGEHQTKTWVTTEVVKVPGTTASGNHPGSPVSSQGSTPSTPVVVTAGAGKAAFSVGGALVAAFAALL